MVEFKTNLNEAYFHMKNFINRLVTIKTKFWSIQIIDSFFIKCPPFSHSLWKILDFLSQGFLHDREAWMSRNHLLEAGAKSEV